ncbi:MAG: hypothetical protein EBU84_12110 [Actinobacteria bacterium]|nr:hypothetical protein [Actinomycetota bacterium]
MDFLIGIVVATLVVFYFQVGAYMYGQSMKRENLEPVILKVAQELEIQGVTLNEARARELAASTKRHLLIRCYLFWPIDLVPAMVRAFRKPR